jgi:hypothetical protein
LKANSPRLLVVGKPTYFMVASFSPAVVFLHHHLLADHVIAVVIAPQPAPVRQHCRRRRQRILLLPPPTLSALSTTRSRCRQRDDINAGAIATTSSSQPTDSVQHHDLNGRRSCDGQWDGGAIAMDSGGVGIGGGVGGGGGAMNSVTAARSRWTETGQWASSQSQKSTEA